MDWAGFVVGYGGTGTDQTDSVSVGKRRRGQWGFKIRAGVRVVGVRERHHHPALHGEAQEQLVLSMST